MKKVNFSLLIKITGIVFTAFAIVLGNEIRLGIDRYIKNTLETDAEATIRNLDKFSKSYIESYVVDDVDFSSEKFKSLYDSALSGDSTKVKCLTDAQGKILDTSREGATNTSIGVFLDDFMGYIQTVCYFDLSSLSNQDIEKVERYLLDNQNQTIHIVLGIEDSKDVERGIFSDIKIHSLSLNDEKIIEEESKENIVYASGNVTNFDSYDLELLFPINEATSKLSKSTSYDKLGKALVFDYKNIMNGLEYHIQTNFQKFINNSQILTSTNYMDYYLIKPYTYNGKQYSTVMIRLLDWSLISEDETVELSNNETLDNITKGYIFISQEYQNLFMNNFKQFMLDNSSTYILALLLIAMICLALAYIIIKPIRRIETTAKHIALKEFDYPIDMTRHDELGDLARSIDRMSKELEKTINNLHQEIERVQRLEILRKEFVSNFTHEIKTPLGIINGFSELVELEQDENKRNEYIGIIQGETKRINELVLAMLDLSKLESQNISLQIEEIDLLDIVDECLDSLMYLFEKKNIKLETSLDCAFVHADPFKMEMVISNFISNALRYTEENHKVYVHVDEHCLSVENEGAHIPEEDLDKVWLTFHKVDKARNEEGTGLGLAICKAILDLHHFDYGVKNTERGVLFYFKY